MIDTAFDEGKTEGKEEGKSEIVMNMIKKGLPVDLISEITGFSIEQIYDDIHLEIAAKSIVIKIYYETRAWDTLGFLWRFAKTNARLKRRHFCYPQVCFGVLFDRDRKSTRLNSSHVD